MINKTLKQLNLFLVISFILLGITACSLSHFFELPDELPHNILFKDDFSDPTSGWERTNEDEGITNYENGYYRIFVNTKHNTIWADPGLSFTDARISVTTTKLGGPDDNVFGIICRYEPPNNFYFFFISSDGYYGIGKTINGKQTILGAESMLKSSAIKQGNETNTIQADCVGERLKLYVNEQLVEEVTDNTLKEGSVGLIAGSYEHVGVDIYFDDFIVSKP